MVPLEEIEMNDKTLITQDREILGGTAVFAGTRVPVKTFWDYLEKGHALDMFLDDFPTVSHEHALQILALAQEKLN